MQRKLRSSVHLALHCWLLKGMRRCAPVDRNWYGASKGGGRAWGMEGEEAEGEERSRPAILFLADE